MVEEITCQWCKKKFMSNTLEAPDGTPLRDVVCPECESVLVERNPGEFLKRQDKYISPEATESW